ncbi:MAG: DUF2442 domain-containing protein [Chloroflexota bacterium]|nr:DUF2442 domain-containing protein [Chloroflexota bacterium]MDE2945722.1 DUF2442 domain-containing protein [Chloroflexota bacterium]
MDLMPLVNPVRCAAKKVTFSKKFARVSLADGRVISLPLKFYPRLQNATDEQRKKYELFGLNIYWDDLDEGIDLTAMLTGMYRRREHMEQES